MDIEGNLLIEGKQYVIKIKGDSEPYVGEYYTTKTNLNGKEVYVFKMVYKILPNGSRQIFSREITFTTDSVRLVTPEYLKRQQQSVLGKNKRQDDAEEQERKRLKEEQDKSFQKMMEASHFLHEMKNKARNGYLINDNQHQKIQEALSLIPPEEHYRWPEFTKSLEEVDGGSNRKRYKKKRKSKKRKSNKKKRRTIRNK